MIRLAATQLNTNLVKTRYLFYDNLNEDLGAPTNLAKSLAHSEPTLESYLFMENSLESGSLPPRLRVKIALLVAESNMSRYCLALHTNRARKLGLSESDIFNARQANAVNIKECTALKFTRSVLDYRGILTDFEFDTLREVGFTDREITEIIASVAFNIFSNYFSNLAQPANDFPQIELIQRPVTRN